MVSIPMVSKGYKMLKHRPDWVNEGMVNVLFENEKNFNVFAGDYTLKQFKCYQAEEKLRDSLTEEQLKIFEDYIKALEDKLNEEQENE
jgi:hypothetical protein